MRSPASASRCSVEMRSCYIGGCSSCVSSKACCWPTVMHPSGALSGLPVAGDSSDSLNTERQSDWTSVTSSTAACAREVAELLLVTSVMLASLSSGAQLKLQHPVWARSPLHSNPPRQESTQQSTHIIVYSTIAQLNCSARSARLLVILVACNNHS